MTCPKSYKSIKAVKKACDSGEIDESRLKIVMDNDETSFYCDGERDSDGCRPNIFNGNGYRDIESLYPLVFPKAKVEWC